MKRSTVLQLLLWLFVLSTGMIAGSSVYERVVVTPLWAGDLPQSVREWDRGVIQEAFFGIATPVYGLCSLLLAIASRWLPERQRRWSLIAGVSGVVTVVWTFVFFVPILLKTQLTAGAGLSDQEVGRLASQFTGWQWGRWALIFGGWLAGLRALSLTPAAPPRTLSGLATEKMPLEVAGQTFGQPLGRRLPAGLLAFQANTDESDDPKSVSPRVPCA